MINYSCDECGRHIAVDAERWVLWCHNLVRATDSSFSPLFKPATRRYDFCDECAKKGVNPMRRSLPGEGDES